MTRAVGGRRPLALLLAALVAPSPGAPARAADLAPNVVPLAVRTPLRGFNRLVIALTVCEPGSERCARIENVMVDTGAAGLRLEAAALPGWLRLPPAPGPDGRPLAECLRYVADVAWGPVRRADLRIGGLRAPDLPVQVMADEFAAVPDDGGAPRPAACPPSGVRPTSNGTLGVGPNLDDCPGACDQDPARPLVFACSPTGCDPLPGRVAPGHRLPNPVTRLGPHDNGLVVALPPAPPGGAAAVEGTLTFGVGTAANNALGAAALVPLDRRGRFVTRFRGVDYPDSYIDSGTPTLILPDADLPRCAGAPWAYCAAPERPLSAELAGPGGAPVGVAFAVGDYEGALARGHGAVGALAVAAPPGSRAVVWGAPFFLGRRVVVLLDGARPGDRPDAAGPAYAVQDHPGP